jgi:hypothetical protein
VASPLDDAPAELRMFLVAMGSDDAMDRLEEIFAPGQPVDAEDAGTRAL